MLSKRDSTSGWSGTSNGRRVTITLESASPGTSTPVQKLSVPNSTLFTSFLNASSMACRCISCP